MKLFKVGAMALLTLAVVASCSKYEEGSKFTLLSKKARLVGEWKVTNIEVNGTAQNLNGFTYNNEFEKDGTFTSTVVYGGTTFTDQGTWKFSDDKADLIVTNSNGDVTTLEIVRLASKDLKVKETDGSDVTITTCEKQ